MTTDITALFVCLDDFGKLYESAQKSHTLPSLGFLAHCRENFDALTEIRKMPCFSHEN